MKVYSGNIEVRHCGLYDVLERYGWVFEASRKLWMR